VEEALSHPFHEPLGEESRYVGAPAGGDDSHVFIS
jgi:hypothetical protein